MGIDKTELKIAMLHTRGVDTENAKEAADREVEQARGAVAVLKIVQNNLTGVINASANDIRGKEEFSPDQVSFILKHMQRCVDSIVSTSTQLAVQQYRLEGRAQLLKEQVDGLQKEIEKEKEKLELQRNPPTGEQGNGRRPPARLVGVHPGESLKNQRRREAEEAEKPKTPLKIVKNEDTSEKTDTADSSETPKPPKPRRRRTRVPTN